MNKIQILFMGTSQFAVPALQCLINSEHEVVKVITQPDRPKGRGKKLQPTPVKSAALIAGLDIWQPLSIKEPQTISEILKIPLDLIVVASYGQIIPLEVLEHPRMGSINIHASMLPAYRGAAPIQRAIMDGKETTGITIMYMAAGLDTGDIIIQQEIPIGKNQNHGNLEKELAKLGAKLLLSSIAELSAGNARPIPQEDGLATYAARLTREEENLDFTQSAVALHNQIRGLSPEPGAYTLLEGKRLKIYVSRIEADYPTSKLVPGTVLALAQDGFFLQTGEGVLAILEVQKEGKSRMPALEFAKGIPNFVSQILGI